MSDIYLAAVLEAARAACAATTVHQRYACVQQLNGALKRYDTARERADKDLAERRARPCPPYDGDRSFGEMA